MTSPLASTSVPNGRMPSMTTLPLPPRISAPAPMTRFAPGHAAVAVLGRFALEGLVTETISRPAGGSAQMAWAVTAHVFVPEFACPVAVTPVAVGRRPSRMMWFPGDSTLTPAPIARRPGGQDAVADLTFDVFLELVAETTCWSATTADADSTAVTTPTTATTVTDSTARDTRDVVRGCRAVAVRAIRRATSERDMCVPFRSLPRWDACNRLRKRHTTGSQRPLSFDFHKFRHTNTVRNPLQRSSPAADVARPGDTVSASAATTIVPQSR